MVSESAKLQILTYLIKTVSFNYLKFNNNNNKNNNNNNNNNNYWVNNNS